MLNRVLLMTNKGRKSSQGWQSPIPGAGTPAGRRTISGTGGCGKREIRGKLIKLNLVEGEVEGIDKGICLQGGQPAEGQVDDRQEEDVDAGCCNEEAEEEFNRKPGLQHPLELEVEYHGVEEGKDADHAEENGNED